MYTRVSEAPETTYGTHISNRDLRLLHENNTGAEPNAQRIRRQIVLMKKEYQRYYTELTRMTVVPYLPDYECSNHVFRALA